MNMEEKLLGSPDNITNVNQERINVKVDGRSKTNQLVSEEKFKSIQEMLLRNDVSQLEKISLCRTHWRKLGRAVKTEELGKCQSECSIYLSGDINKWIRIKLYSYRQTRQRRTLKQRPPNDIDYTKALFVVNQSAKRYRDMASRCYRKRLHGLAGFSRDKKEKLYELKDRGLVHCFRNGLVNFEGIHGKLAYYRSVDGQHSFHSPLFPETADISKIEDDELITVSAKPAQKRYLLKDAIHTLEPLPDGNDGFKRVDSLESVNDCEDGDCRYEYDNSEDDCRDDREEDEYDRR